MGMLSRLEQRSGSLEDPRTDLGEWIDRGMAYPPTSSGTSVNETTALNLSGVWAAVRVLTDMVASIPVHVYKRLEPRGKERASDHPVFRMLHDRPNPEMSAFTFKEVLQGHLATWGNAYAEKERNGRGEVVHLWPIAPSRVTPRYGDVRGRVEKVFEVDVGGVRKPFSADQIMHIPGFGYDGLVGYSPIKFARESLGLAKAAEEFGARMFGQGLRTSGVISSPTPISDKARPNILKSINGYNQGLSASHRIMLLEEGLTWTPTSIPPDDAQFLETRKFQTTEIARWFKVPPHKLGDLERATFSNIEHQSIEFVTDTARPWCVRWEQVFNEELFSKADRGTYFSEFLMDALLRGDAASRGTFYTSMVNIGAYSQNDVREKENENPIDGGDEYWVQGALVPISRVNDIIDSKKGAPVPAVAAPSIQDDPPTRSLWPVLVDAAERVIRREVDEISSALKKGSLEFWAAGFYEDHAGFAAKRFLPACLTIDPEGGAKLAGKMGADWASGSLSEIRRAVLAGEDVEAIVKRWEASRAEEWAHSIEPKEAA